MSIMQMATLQPMARGVTFSRALLTAKLRTSLVRMDNPLSQIRDRDRGAAAADLLAAIEVAQKDRSY